MEEYHVVEKPVSPWVVFFLNFLLGLLMFAGLIFVESHTGINAQKGGELPHDWQKLMVIGIVFSVLYGTLKAVQIVFINRDLRIGTGKQGGAS